MATTFNNNNFTFEAITEVTCVVSELEGSIVLVQYRFLGLERSKFHRLISFNFFTRVLIFE